MHQIKYGCHITALLWQNRAGTPWMQFWRSTEPLLSKSLCFQMHLLRESVCFQLHPLPETRQSQPRLFTVTLCILPPCCIPRDLHWTCTVYFIGACTSLTSCGTYIASPLCVSWPRSWHRILETPNPVELWYAKPGFFQKPSLCLAKKQRKQTKQTNTKHEYKHLTDLTFSYLFCFCWLFHFCCLLVLFVFRFFSLGCPVHFVVFLSSCSR